MISSYYIYYKVAPPLEARVRAAVNNLQHAIGKKTGITGRLLCRRDQPDTWMEIYENVADEAAFEAVLDAELQRVGFAGLLGPGSSRVTEIFRPL